MPRGIPNEDRTKIGLPPRPFLYTIDQLAVMLDLPERQLRIKHIYHEGRDIGHRSREHMVARNIAGPDDTPDWRVADREFIRWMRLKGFKFYDRGTITN